MKNQEKFPLISLGMPIRNGMPFLKRSLKDIVQQNYPNIEIVISNNASIDNTEEFLKNYDFKDRNVKVYNQNKVLTAIENFNFVRLKAKGKYFMWCAHDDLRNLDQIPLLTKALEENREAILSFGDLYISNRFNYDYSKIIFNFNTDNISKLLALYKTSNQKCYQFYGLWRLHDLNKIPMFNNAIWPDLPILNAGLLLGDFIHVSNANFFYLEISKTKEQRASYQDNIKRKVNKLWLIYNFLLVSAKVGYIVKGYKGCISLFLFSIIKLFSVLKDILIRIFNFKTLK